MNFTKPSIEKIYKTLVNNDFLINYLKENNCLITNAMLYENYSPSEIKKMGSRALVKNVQIMTELAEVLDNYSEQIKSNQLWYLLSNHIAWNEIAYTLRIKPTEMDKEIYKNIIYTYKYCTVSSFFQNNRDKFIPENDFFEMEKNPAAKAFYDAMMKEFDKLDCVLGKCCEYLDFDKIPWDLITYLTQLLGFEKSTINATEDDEPKFRELAKNILDIYRVKGTDYSFELFFNFLGYNIKIKEFYFDRRLYYNTNNGGNQETGSIDSYDYEYYLTSLNPITNEINDIGTNEIVKPEDITPQYSLHEFSELCSEYGPAAVLGYSPIYNIYDNNGEVIDTKEYTGKVYKYFKTNLVYYEIGLDRANPTAQQIKSITKYLDFLTPSYIMRTIKLDTYSEKNDEQIGFDGDGTKKPDMYNNFNGFEMLDGEDWSQEYQDRYLKQISHDKYGVTNESGYVGKQETFKDYRNSIGGKEFRLPIDHRIMNKSVSRFMTNSSGTPKLDYKRLKYLVVRKVGNSYVDNPNTPGATLYPYYTVPPFVGQDVTYDNIQNKFYEDTKNINLAGYRAPTEKDFEGFSPEEKKEEKRRWIEQKSVKELIKEAHLINPIDFVTDLSIDDFVANDKEFNKLHIEETMNRKFTLVSKCRYGKGTDYGNASICYYLNYRGYKFDNIKTYNLEHIVTSKQVQEYYKHPDFYKNLNYGGYTLAYNGTLDDGELLVYKFGNYKMPNPKSNTYRADLISYLNSFNYALVKDYNGTIKPSGTNLPVGLSTNYITKNNLKEAREYVEKIRNIMIDEASNGKKITYDINHITDMLFLIREDNEYYRPIRTSVISAMTTNSGKVQIFDTYDQAVDFFKENVDRVLCNNEFYIKGEPKEKGIKESDPSLYTFVYTNRRKGTLIYSLKDAKLYSVNGNSEYDIIEEKDFYGRLSIYHKDPEGKYGFKLNNVDTDGKERYNDYLSELNPTDKIKDNIKYSIGINGMSAKDIHAEIDLYDKYWKGYDEQADEEDFIFYNSPHVVDWPMAKLINKRINRPIKGKSDEVFNEDAKNSNLYIDDFEPIKVKVKVPYLDKIGMEHFKEEEVIKYKKDDLIKDEIDFDLEKGYYKTIAQNIVDEISLNTVDNFTDLENLEWTFSYVVVPESVVKNIDPSFFGLYEYDDSKEKWILTKDKKYNSKKEYSTYTRLGLLSIVESNMETVTGIKSDNREYDYYSKLSDFFQDYYRIVYYDNFNIKHLPKSLVKDLLKDGQTDLTKEQIDKIKKYFDLSMIQIASIVESISRDRIYYSYIGRWKRMVDTDSGVGVWTYDMNEQVPELNKLWLADPFASDPYNPIFYEIDEDSQKELKLYFANHNLSDEVLNKYINYRDNYIQKNPQMLKKLRFESKSNFIVDEETGLGYYPFIEKTGLVQIIDSKVRDLNRKYKGFIDIEGGAREDLLGKDAYSLNGQHVYTDEGYYGRYVYSGYDDNDKPKKFVIKLKFALTMDSNGDFFIPYNLNYGLTNYSKDFYDEHREIYSEFTELIDLFIAALPDKDPSEINAYLKQYYYNKLVKLYREAEIKDVLPITLSVKGKKPMLAYPKLTEKFNGSAGTFSSPSTLLSSYKNNGGMMDTDIRLNFFGFDILINSYREATLKFKTTHLDFMNSFGYDYSNFYKVLTLKNLSEEQYKKVSEEIEEMYRKQFACIKPYYIFRDGSNEYYDKFLDDNKKLTVWQRIRNKFSVDFSEAEAVAYDKDGNKVTDELGYIIDKSGNRYPPEASKEALKRFKESFKSGYIEIIVKDKTILPTILDIPEINDFVNNNENIGTNYSILNEKEREYICGYLSVRQLNQKFIDNYISFPKSLEWVAKDENNIAKEYISFGDDRSVNIVKRNVYYEHNTGDPSKDYSLDMKEYEKSINQKGTVNSGYYSLHDEEVVAVSPRGYALDENDEEIVNYDKKKTFEDQGIKVKYVKVPGVKINTSADSFKDNEYQKCADVFVDAEDESKGTIKIPLGECKIETNELGKVILKVPSRIIHTSRINSVKILFNISYVIVRKVVKQCIAMLDACYARVTRRVTLGDIKFLINYIKKEFGNHSVIRKIYEDNNFVNFDSNYKDGNKILIRKIRKELKKVLYDVKSEDHNKAIIRTKKNFNKFYNVIKNIITYRTLRRAYSGNINFDSSMTKYPDFRIVFYALYNPILIDYLAKSSLVKAIYKIKNIKKILLSKVDDIKKMNIVHSTKLKHMFTNLILVTVGEAFYVKTFYYLRVKSVFNTKVSFFSIKEKSNGLKIKMRREDFNRDLANNDKNIMVIMKYCRYHGFANSNNKFYDEIPVFFEESGREQDRDKILDIGELDYKDIFFYSDLYFKTEEGYTDKTYGDMLEEASIEDKPMFEEVCKTSILQTFKYHIKSDRLFKEIFKFKEEYKGAIYNVKGFIKYLTKAGSNIAAAIKCNVKALACHFVVKALDGKKINFANKFIENKLGHHSVSKALTEDPNKKMSVLIAVDKPIVDEVKNI